jgi:release factor glutamine methyltransferase
LALDGGTDGLVVIRRIVEQAPLWLVPGGVLALEVGYDQGPRALELVKARGFIDVALHRDYGKNDRVVCGTWK